MKHLIFSLMIALASVEAMADQVDTRTVKAGPLTVTAVTTTKAKGDRKDSTYVPTYTDTADDGTTVVSSVVSTDVDDDDMTAINDILSMVDAVDDGGSSSIIGRIFGTLGGMVMFMLLLIPILLIALLIALPIIVLHNVNKRRRERYSLIEKALETGQPLPDDVMDELKGTARRGGYNDIRNRGIRNMCLGASLCIFLWALTSSFALGCIGLLIGFRGLGQYLTSGKSESHSEEKKKEEE